MASVRHALVAFVGITLTVLLAAGWVDATSRNAAAPAEAVVAGPDVNLDSGEAVAAAVPQTDAPAGLAGSDHEPSASETTADPYTAQSEAAAVAKPAASAPHRSKGVAAEHKPVAPKAKSRTLKRVYRVTAYCDDGITASGRRVGVGQCAGPANLPFGSKVHIPALNRTLVVTDRTAKRFRHNTVDIFMPDRADCVEFGRNYLECVVVLPDKVSGRR